jgi:hypothetical protein
MSIEPTNDTLALFFAWNELTSPVADPTRYGSSVGGSSLRRPWLYAVPAAWRVFVNSGRRPALWPTPRYRRGAPCAVVVETKGESAEARGMRRVVWDPSSSCESKWKWSMTVVPRSSRSRSNSRPKSRQNSDSSGERTTRRLRASAT